MTHLEAFRGRACGSGGVTPMDRTARVRPRSATVSIGPMDHLDARYPVTLGFTPRDRSFPDPDRPPLLRARPRAATPYGDDGVEDHVCEAIDMVQDHSVRPDVFTFGFDRVDLSEHDDLQAACSEIARTGSISEPIASAIRAALDGAVLRSSSGRRLRVMFVAAEGLILRTGGPNRMAFSAPNSKGMNGHGPAVAVHADQDVHGTPLVQLMDGRAPELFRHDSPGGHNHDASLMLVNLWIPIRQITRPLVLGDGRSVDRVKDQARYGLATDTFLDRDDDQLVNDIWTFLHDPDQRWYFRSEMDHRSAYVFNTLSTPHASGILPGEDVAERCYLALEQAASAVGRGDATELELAAAGDLEAPDGTPPALRRSISEMAALLSEAGTDPVAVGSPEAEAWSARALAARRSVVRMSVELRLVVSAER